MSAPLLEARGMTKRYGHVEVLRGTDFEAREGEVTALIGDNGAGKSTLVKILAGVVPADGGEVRWRGAPLPLGTPTAARRAGIETVFQDLALAPDLGAAENTYLGRELVRPGLLGRLGLLDNRRMRETAAATFRSLGTAVKDLDAPVAALSGGQRQSVAICRAVMWAEGLVIMDEPTAALGVKQTRLVLDLIRRVADRGVAVVLISHNMPDVLAVADRVQVLRLGVRVADRQAADSTIESLVAAMTGATEATR